ncbi:hypothetical protein ABER61_27920 [Brevibacillus formosus]|uniref:Uncharacterized protein n=1 Tax=Brevibacillus formosus TaxID=54913 RepID=A0ABQ0TDQ2_9BACL|nr:hypothetical protein [Brevibacillus formosus]MED1955131.1 hypothetical protein [Brevibacillus formosus]GED61421.1 hypothetical protein BFO01nite_55530 [Brevibacillus formosus]
MKKNLSSIITCAVLLTSVFIAPIADAAKADFSGLSSKDLANKVLSLSSKQVKSEQKSLESAIAKLSDKEFDSFIHNLVMANKGDDKELKDKLKPIGVELETKKNDRIGPTAIEAGDLNFSVSSAKRTGESFYRLIASWDPDISEVYPATYDLVSIEWDPKVGQYYSSNVGSTSYTTARDGSKRLEGVYLFNVHDYKLGFGSYAAVYVTKKTNSTLEYGSKYVHTYDTVSWSGNFQANFTWEKLGPTGGASFSLSPSMTEKSWQVWDDGALEW